MKNRLFAITNTFLTILVLNSCQLAELDEAPSQEMDEIQLPNSVPSTIEEFEMNLHGGTERRWQATSFSLAGFEGVQNCRLDDVTTIKNDGTYTYDGGEELCGAEDDTRLRAGTWEIINDGNNMLFDKGQPNEYMAEVDGFENGMLVLSGQYIGLVIKGVYTIEQ